jgi:ribosomal protein L37E
MFLPNFGFSAFGKTKVIMEVMQMKCRVCGKDTSEFADGYCLRCEKVAADVDAELAIGVEQQ